ncbi:MAG: hypothetical protein Q8M29_07740 [Bacteroidota bacterium]|nr:hypothetical protein [Bacteroidota bacterium]
MTKVVLLTPDQLKELNKRRKDHLLGKSKSYTFDEVKKDVLSKHEKNMKHA